MSRELKFRVWNKVKNKFEIPFDIEEICYKDYLGYSFELIDGKYNENWIVQQFTGLKDKNRKEIYEGDIICKTVVWLGTSYNEVKFKDGTFYLDGYQKYVGRGFFENIENSLEIIGNILENPELLNK